MSVIENAHCRLCAELKCTTKLVDLFTRPDLRVDIVAKLKKININIDFTAGTMPSTICFTCITSLEKVIELIVEIQKAQVILEEIVLVKDIKTEVNAFEDNENHETDLTYDLNIKIEKSDIQTRSYKKSTKSKVKKKKTIKVDNCLDAIPLSQIKLTWRDYSWQCAYCETLFPTIGELKNHSLQYHKCCNPYRCTDCNIRKLNIDSFLAHVKCHRKYLKFSCYKCFQKFSKIADAKMHHNTHITSKFVCTGCNEIFHTSEELNNHSNEYNRDLKIRQLPQIAKESLNKSLNCPICKKNFKYKGTLTNHLLTHTDRKRDHTCDKCGKRFLSKQNLASHMMLHDDVRPYPCEICKFRFRTPAQLRTHVGIHDGIKPFACSECGRCFRLKKQLVNHSIVHTDAFPFVCSYCNKRFRFKSILDQHIRQHTGVKPYSCQYCQRSFTNWPNFNKHMNRRHDLNMAKKKRTPEGVYPIDPATGQMIVFEESNKTSEWKNKLLKGSRKPGRPKLKDDTANATSNDIQGNNVLKNDPN